MTSPRHAVDTPNGRYYKDPATGELLISVTNVISEWAKPALVPAAAKETAKFFLENLSQAVRASRKPDDLEAFVKEAKAAHKNVWESKRDIGTLVHAHAEAHVLGTPIAPDERAQPYIGSYQGFLTDFGIDISRDVRSAEITVLHRGHGYAGTADLWADIRFPAETGPPHPRYRSRTYPDSPVHTPNGLWLIDIKTSAADKPVSAVYRDHEMQLAALRYAQVALLPDDTDVPVPEFVGAAILNLRPNGYGFVPLPAGEATHEAFTHLVQVARFAHGLDLRPFKPALPPTHSARKGAA